MKKLQLLILCIATSWTVMGQSYNAFISAADEAYSGEDYYSALIYYQEALEFEKGGLELDYKLAEAALGFRSYDLAAKYYAKVAENDSENAYPDVTFKQARVKQLQGDYAGAKELYAVYLSENDGDDSYLSQVAKKEVRACDWALQMEETAEESELYTIDHLGDHVNTKHSEFGALALGDTLWYSSLKYFDKKDSHDPNRPYSNVLFSKNGAKGKRYNNKTFKKEQKHVAHTSFTPSNNTIYYTVCEYIVDATIRCDIYYRKKLDDNKWGTEVAFPHNLPGNTTTQPSIGLDPATGNQALYFVSDREGGEGGFDIWYSVLTDSVFAAPVNLGHVNTIQDDITPYYDYATATLYFSSEGYQGLGGYDIYSAAHGTAWDEVEHLGPEINSRQHDIYYSISDDPDIAYMSSDRDGSKYIDKKTEGCCFDIYKITRNELDINLDLTTFNKKSLDPLNGVSVRLINVETGEVVWTDMHPDDNAYTTKLDRDTEYMIIADKVGFTSDTIPFTTVGIKKSTTITKKAYLAPDFIDLEVDVFDKITRDPLNGATVVLIDKTDPDVDPITITHDGTHIFNFPVKCGHTYELRVTRPGYNPETTQLTIDDCSTGTVKKSVYLTKNYLPTSLYFDNDRPDRRTLSETTRKTYSQTYERYYAKKDRFKQVYSRRLSGQDKTDAQQEMDDFFKYKVRRGMEQLTRMFADLENYLQSGDKINLGIRGFASPLATNTYNQNLSKRRINSVLNEMRAYKDGVFIPYLESGQLSLNEVPFGEEQAPEQVSDSNTDVRRSIYSVEASEERRVEIIEITVNKE